MKSTNSTDQSLKSDIKSLQSTDHHLDSDDQLYEHNNHHPTNKSIHCTKLKTDETNMDATKQEIQKMKQRLIQLQAGTEINIPQRQGDDEQYIQQLIDFMQKSADQYRFLEAEAARIKIEELKDGLNRNIKSNSRYIYAEQIIELKQYYQQGIQIFNEFWDQKINSCNKKAYQMDQEMLQIYQKELNKLKKYLEDKFCIQAKNEDEFHVEVMYKNKLVFKELYSLDQKDSRDKCVDRDQLIKNGYEELLDDKMDRLLDKRQKMVRVGFERVINKYESQILKFKQLLCQYLRIDQSESINQIYQIIKQSLKDGNSYAQQQEIMKHIDSLKTNTSIQKLSNEMIEYFDEYSKAIISEMKQLKSQQMQIQKMMFRSAINSKYYIEQLKQCKIEVVICNANNINNYRDIITCYEEKQIKYRIYINLSSKKTSLESKMQLIDMVRDLEVEYKVGKLSIKIGDENKVDSKILDMVAFSYVNLYNIELYDKSSKIDYSVHELVIGMLGRIELLSRFRIDLNGGMGYDGLLEVTKRYNGLIKGMKYLQYLRYRWTGRSFDSIANSRRQIRWMVEAIDEL